MLRHMALPFIETLDSDLLHHMFLFILQDPRQRHFFCEALHFLLLGLYLFHISTILCMQDSLGKASSVSPALDEVSTPSLALGFPQYLFCHLSHFNCPGPTPMLSPSRTRTGSFLFLPMVEA